MSGLLINAHARGEVDGFADAAPMAFHRRLPGYAVTPLVPLHDVAHELGIGQLWLKDESARLGLPAFKILGASWAVYRALVQLLGHEPGPWETVEELAERFAPLRPLTLTTATDGNHGRAVARMARLLGLEAHIFVPASTAMARQQAISEEGARVVLVDGDYDDAVAAAAAQAGPRTLVISDHAWEGYTQVPAFVIEGYSTIFREVDAQLEGLGEQRPDLVLVQVGVGALAAAVARHYKARGRDPRARVIGFEPEGAGCLRAALEADRITAVPGPHTSIMVGMNCGTLSLVAWPILREGADACLELSDARAKEAMQLLAERGIVAGETGASGLAALRELLLGPSVDDAWEKLGVGPRTRALIFLTEGATDPESYEAIVGRPPEDVRAGSPS